jgi:glycosyltransferase involved in cell wall biosynthesis
VVIPCYRCAATIQRAVASVAAQTLIPAEIILVEDCSPDGTLERIRQLQSRYPPDWLKVITLDENSGPSAARNRGWDAATSKYVAFLDADDTWHRSKLDVQFAWMEQHPEIVVTGTRPTTNPDTNTTVAIPVASLEIRPRQLLIRNTFCTSGVMLLRELQSRFNETKQRAEDYELWLTILLNGYRLSLLDAELAIYHKSLFGDSGLSGDLRKMLTGQLETYKTLANSGRISKLLSIILAILAWMGFGRRVMIVMANRVCGRNLARE